MQSAGTMLLPLLGTIALPERVGATGQVEIRQPLVPADKWRATYDARHIRRQKKAMNTLMRL